MKQVLTSLFTCALIFFSAGSHAQQKMQSADELLSKDPAWPLIKQWIDAAKNKVEVLEADSARAKEALVQLQMSTYSTLGSVTYSTGGILVDHGWIRILGSGSPRFERSVAAWNKGKTFENYGEQPGYMLVADDAVGGFFAVNYGALGADLKNVYYLAPNSLKWESLGAGYSEFMVFCFNSDLNKFYEGLRWKDWNKFIDKLKSSEVYHFYPYLWSEEGKDIEKDRRTLVPIEEQFIFNMQARHDLGIKEKK